MAGGAVAADGVATWLQLVVAIGGVVVPVLIVGIGLYNAVRASSSETQQRLSRMEDAIGDIREQLTGTREKLAYIQGRDDSARDAGRRWKR